MKFNKNERFKEIFKFNEEGIKELTAKSIRESVTPIQNGEIIDLPVRDYVLDIEFEDKGFKDFEGSDALNITSDYEGLMLLKHTVKERHNEVLKVTPNYIINIKKGEIFNIFDSVSRLKFYNFLTDIENGKGNNWKIVTAMDRVQQIYIIDTPTMSEVRGEEANNKLSVLKDRNKEGFADNLSDYSDTDGLPIEQVDKILKENKVSLLGTDETLTTLAIKLRNKEITEQGIINIKTD